MLFICTSFSVLHAEESQFADPTAPRVVDPAASAVIVDPVTLTIPVTAREDKGEATKENKLPDPTAPAPTVAPTVASGDEKKAEEPKKEENKGEPVPAAADAKAHDHKKDHGHADHGGHGHGSHGSKDAYLKAKKEQAVNPEMYEMDYLYGKRNDETDPKNKEGVIEGWAGWRNNKYRKEVVNNDLLPVPDRWRQGMSWNALREKGGGILNPYKQNLIKGDYPIVGQSIFLSTLAISDTLIEGNRTPIPRNVSTVDPNGFGFYGDGDKLLINQNFIVSIELFKGETDFKPREWEIRATPVFNVNYLNVEENFIVKVDPRRGADRLDHQIAFQELFAEYHFRDVSENYDFISTRTGIQLYNNDFRGFLFSDNNLMFRIFGTFEANRLQYNLAYAEMLNKDTNSGLNTIFEFKDEHVILANLVRQDTFKKGYNAIFNLAFSAEEESKEYNQNGLIVRPAPIGSLNPHSVKAGYVGFGGDGHIGRVNISHQFYQAFGKDSENGLSGKEQTINAQMFALELSYDRSWQRFRGSYFYSSGDDDIYDDTAGGFDSIIDNPNFAGGQFSYWVRQGLVAGNAAVLLKDRGTLMPTLTTSKGEGQANFVNPGVHILNAGYDAEVTQRLKTVANVNYIRLANSESLEQLLQQNKIDEEMGVDVSLGVIYRPTLSQNIIITGGAAAFFPLDGFKTVYNSETQYSAFINFLVRY